MQMLCCTSTIDLLAPLHNLLIVRRRDFGDPEDGIRQLALDDTHRPLPPLLSNRQPERLLCKLDDGRGHLAHAIGEPVRR